MDYDLIIIGAGPAGYVAAIRAGQLGIKTALVEKKHLGGMCLNWGCIPSKSMIESGKFYKRIKDAEKFGIDGIEKANIKFNWKNAKSRADKIVTKLTKGVEFLVKKNKIDIINGQAKIISPTQISVDNRTVEATNIIIATGSFPHKFDYEISTDKVIQLNRLFELDELPENIVVYGKGPVLIEIAQFLNFIDKKVTIIFTDEDILPGFDDYLKDQLLKRLKMDKIAFYYKKDITEFNDNEVKIKDKSIAFDIVINASWRGAVLPHSDIKLELDKDGFLNVNEKLQTNHKNIYAIGDVNGKSFLAHPGSAQGILAVNSIKGVENTLDIEKYPLNLYASPEVAQIGKTENQVKAEGIDYKISSFALAGNGKAMIEEDTTGFIRIISDKKYGEVLGVQIMAENATDLISEAAAYMSVEATIYDIANTIHAHPTVSEIFFEAGLDGFDSAIHK